MDRRRLRVGLIGLGDIAAKAYLPVLAADAGIEPVLITRDPPYGQTKGPGGPAAEPLASRAAGQLLTCLISSSSLPPSSALARPSASALSTGVTAFLFALVSAASRRSA